MALIGLTGAGRSQPDPPTSVRAAAPCQIPPLRLPTALLRGELRFHIHEGSFRAEHFIDFCKQLMKDAGNDIFLIVDGSPVHTARKTREFVQSTGGKLSLYFLPGCSPELNPDEWVVEKCEARHDRPLRRARERRLESRRYRRAAASSEAPGKGARILY